jgi:hypothetical protein
LEQKYCFFKRKKSIFSQKFEENCGHSIDPCKISAAKLGFGSSSLHWKGNKILTSRYVGRMLSKHFLSEGKFCLRQNLTRDEVTNAEQNKPVLHRNVDGQIADRHNVEIHIADKCKISKICK